MIKVEMVAGVKVEKPEKETARRARYGDQWRIFVNRHGQETVFKYNIVWSILKLLLYCSRYAFLILTCLYFPH
jgi:hypothetical protein